MIDPFHLEAHDVRAVNYNRDIEAFTLLRRILERITRSKSIYQSPTEMGVNRAGFAILDDATAAEAARQEILRRYFRYACEYAMGAADRESVHRVEALMQEFALRPEGRTVVLPARQAAEAAEAGDNKGNQGVFCGAAVQLPDETVVVGRNSPLMHAGSSLVLNAIKVLAEIPRRLHLLSPNVLQSIASLKKDILRRKTISLDLDETLIALSISSTTNPTARLGMEQLKKLSGCEVHLTHIPTPGDEKGLRRLGVNLTCDPNFATNKLFVS